MSFLLEIKGYYTDMGGNICVLEARRVILGKRSCYKSEEKNRRAIFDFLCHKQKLSYETSCSYAWVCTIRYETVNKQKIGLIR